MGVLGRAVGAMSREDGFAVMDVSVDLANDPKVRKLWRHAPDHAGVAFLAYVSTMGESWKAGRRMSVDDAWPPFVPFSKPAVEALIHVGLLDQRGLVLAKTWRGWFDPANERRKKARDRWRRANDKRHSDAVEPSTNDSGDTSRLPRGTNADTASPVPSVPTVPSDPPVNARESEPDDDRPDLEAFLLVTRRAPSPRQRLLLDQLLDRHDVTGPQWAADIILRNPADPIGAVLEADKAWRDEQIAEARKREKPTPKPRRPRGLPQSTRELLDHWAATAKAEPS